MVRPPYPQAAPISSAPSVLSIASPAGSWDPSSILNGVTQAASGVIDADLLSGTATSDPRDAAGWTWRLRDVAGQDISLDKLFSAVYDAVIASLPSLSGDAYIECGITDLADMSSGTCNAFGARLAFTGGFTRVGHSRIAAGGAHGLTLSAASLNNVYGALSGLRTWSAGNNHRSYHASSLDSAGLLISHQTALVTGTVTFAAGPYVYAAVGRSSTGGSQETVSFSPNASAVQHRIADVK